MAEKNHADKASAEAASAPVGERVRAPAPAPAPAPVGERVRAPKGWRRPVANAHRARARRAACRIYKKNQQLDRDLFESECRSDGENVVGLDPATIMLLLQIAWKLYEFWKSRKVAPVLVEMGLPPGELEIDFDVDDE